MATYVELRDLFTDPDLRKKTEVAAVIAAEAELSSTPGSAAGRAWALAVIKDPRDWGELLLKTVLADNKALSVAQITSAADTAFQNKVDAVAPAIINAHAGL